MKQADDGAGGTPRWVHEGGQATAFLRGLAVALTVPGWVLFLTAFGFAALARELGFTLGQAVLTSAAIYALPAQVILVDQIARGATLYAAGFAVTLTAVRLLPMAVNIVPLWRAPGNTRLAEIAAVHFVAVTAWVEGLRRLPALPAERRLSHFLGIGTGMMMATVSGTLTGFIVAAALPPLLSAALLFMTPLYFLCSMLMTSGRPADRIAILLGALLGPPFYLLAPGIDLMLTGLVGGTIAFLIGERRP
ncbi:MAG: AzlC family ABC transporter permease [Hyphomicrobiaceae bacterium]